MAPLATLALLAWLATAAAQAPGEAGSHQAVRLSPPLLESCVACHGAYARQRFPGFGPPAPAGIGTERHELTG
jgi:cytochrome c553